MKPLRRWMFNGLAAVSLLLCVAACILWIWSLHQGFLLTYDQVASRPGVWIVSERAISLERWRLLIEQSRREQSSSVMAFGPQGQMFELTPSRPDSGFGWQAVSRYRGTSSRPGIHWELVRFVWSSSGDPSSTPSRQVLIIPLYAIAMFFAVLPAVSLRRWRSRSKINADEAARRCAACGYDLRASLGRCPECGTVFPTAGC
jgi:hypothetical protein